MYLVWDSGFFPLFSETRSPSFLADLQKKIQKIYKKVSFSKTQYEKCLNGKSILKQSQVAHFHRSFN